MPEPVTPPPRQEIFLHRRVAILRPERIDVRPAGGAVLAPLFGFIVGVVSALAIWFGMAALPLWLLAILLIVAIVAIPFAGIGTVYALVGAHVVVDKAKQSATWQQGFLGMGVGTTELVPFWKIDRIVVEEAGASDEDSGRPVEEFAQWRIVLVKKSGKRLDIGVASAARALRDEAFARAWAVADAVATMAGAPLEVYQPPTEEADSRETAGPVSDTMARDSRADDRPPAPAAEPPDATDATREVRA
jgi:hypothetical protein